MSGGVDGGAQPGGPAATLDGARLRVRRTDRGLLAVRVGDGEEVEDVSLRRAFPLEVADGFVGFSPPTARSWGSSSAWPTSTRRAGPPSRRSSSGSTSCR